MAVKTVDGLRENIRKVLEVAKFKLPSKEPMYIDGCNPRLPLTTFRNTIGYAYPDTLTLEALPHILLLLNRWGTTRDVLRGCCTPRRFLKMVHVLPVFDFLHPHFALDQLINIRDNDWTLYVHERK